MTSSAQPDRAGDDAAVFASALRRLFALAGSPTVRTVAEAVGVSAATVSNWRTGRHLPAEFETIEPMLVWLTTRATTESAVGGEVVTVRQWQQLFTIATGRDPALPVLAQIATVAEAWAATTDTTEPARMDAVRLLLLSCVAVSSTGDLAPRVVNVAGGAQHLAAELVDLGVLSPGRDDEIGGRLQLTDLRLIETWPRLSSWVHQAWPVLISRSALEQDAHRWATASRPRAWLYDHAPDPYRRRPHLPRTRDRRSRRSARSAVPVRSGDLRASPARHRHRVLDRVPSRISPHAAGAPDDRGRLHRAHRHDPRPRARARRRHRMRSAMNSRRDAEVSPASEVAPATASPRDYGRFALFSGPLNKPRTAVLCLVTPLNTTKQTSPGLGKRVFSQIRRLTKPDRVEAWHPPPGTSPNLRSTSLHFGVF